MIRNTLCRDGAETPLALDDFGGKLQIGLAARALEVIEQRRLAIGGCLGNADVARNDRLVDGVTHVGANVLHDLRTEVVAAVIHGQHDAMDAEFRVEAALDLLDGGQKLRQALEGEELALQRHQDGMRG